MKLKLKIKTKKLNPMCLQPLVGPLGLSSKDIIRDIQIRLKNVEIAFFKHYYFTLSIDQIQKKYEIIDTRQPDSRILIAYSLKGELTQETIKNYALNTLHTYAQSIESRVKELNAIAKSCKLNVIK